MYTQAEKNYSGMLLANVQLSRNDKNRFKDSGDKPRSSKSLKNLKNVREQIRKQEKVRKEIQKAAKVNPKSALEVKIKQEIQKAFEKLRGGKVHDDVALLKRAEKRILRKKKKSAENWEKRKEDVKQSQMDKQQKRSDNIAMYRKSGKKQSVVATSTTPASGKTDSSGKMSRKMRRHANLMKYGPKKTRDEREQKRKDSRKEQRKNRSKPSSKKSSRK